MNTKSWDWQQMVRFVDSQIGEIFTDNEAERAYKKVSPAQAINDLNQITELPPINYLGLFG